MQSRLGELGLQSIDVGGAGDCFFRSVSHQLCGNSNHYCWGSIYERHPERFIESNTENSWLRYLNNMCVPGTWADALITLGPGKFHVVVLTFLFFLRNGGGKACLTSRKFLVNCRQARVQPRSQGLSSFRPLEKMRHPGNEVGQTRAPVAIR